MDAIEALINTAQNAYEDHSEAACLGSCLSAARAEHERLKRVEAAAKDYIKLMDLEEAYDATRFPEEDRKKVYDAKWAAFDALRDAASCTAEQVVAKIVEGAK